MEKGGRGVSPGGRRGGGGFQDARPAWILLLGLYTISRPDIGVSRTLAQGGGGDRGGEWEGGKGEGVRLRRRGRRVQDARPAWILYLGLHTISKSEIKVFRTLAGEGSR